MPQIHVKSIRIQGLKPPTYTAFIPRKPTEKESTYVGEDIAENWDALFKTTGLFRRVAIEVSDALGYHYPLDLDERVTSYLQSIRNLEQ